MDTAILFIPQYMYRNDLVFQQLRYADIKDYYLISNYGDIYSIKTNKFLIPFIDKDGYKRIELATYGSSNKKYYVHKLVANQYVYNDNPETNIIVNHKNGIKSDCYYMNLEHCTDEYNRQHAKDNLLMACGERNPNNVFEEIFVHEICQKFQDGLSKNQVCQLYGCSSRVNKPLYDLIRFVYNRVTWKHVSCNYIF